MKCMVENRFQNVAYATDKSTKRESRKNSFTRLMIQLKLNFL